MSVAITTPMALIPPIETPTPPPVVFVMPELTQTTLPAIYPKIQDKIACSCVLYAQLFITLPAIKTPAELQGNTKPVIGSAVLLDYELPHIAIVTKFVTGGFLVKESNFKRCQYTERFIEWLDPKIRGFYI